MVDDTGYDLELRRTNPRGLRFIISGRQGEGRCTVKVNHENGRSMVMNCNIEAINHGFYDWCIKDAFVQDAFPFLNASEREFLLTGITPEWWAVAFPTDDKD